MTADVDTVVLDKCLAFCQALVQSNNHFTFKLAIGNVDFNFEHKKPEKSFLKKKKKSPSQVRREERRRQERAKVNDLKEAGKASEENFKPVAVNCSQCDVTSSSEEDLRAHIETEHAPSVLPTPEKERAFDQIADLELTPPVHNLRKENLFASAVKVLRCSYKRCDETFTSIDAKWNHEGEMSMIGRGLGQQHSGPKRNVKEQGLE